MMQLGIGIGLTGSIANYGPITIAMLATLPAPAGSTVKTTDVRDAWYCDASSTATPDGITVVQGLYGRWVRQNQADPSWALQSDWCIHATTGSDINRGNVVGAPLKTWAEFRRRMQFQTIAQNVIVHILSDLPEWLDLEFTVAGSATSDFGLSIQGDPSAWVTLYSGTLDAVTDMNAATSTPGDITVAGIGDWNTAGPAGTSLIGACRLRMTSGAQVGNIMYPIKRTAATVARRSVMHVSSPTASAQAFTSVNPIAGVSFVAESLPSVYGMSLTVHSQSSKVSTTPRLWASDLAIGSALADQLRGCLLLDAIGPGGEVLNVQRCIINAARIHGPNGLWLADCLLKTAASAILLRDAVIASGCAIMTNIIKLGPTGAFTSDCIFQGASFISSAGYTTLSSTGVFDAPAGAITNGSTIANSMSLSGLLWGSGNAGSPVVSPPGNPIKYSVLPTVTGSVPGTNDFTYGALTASWAAVNASPNGCLVDATRLCGMVK